MRSGLSARPKKFRSRDLFSESLSLSLFLSFFLSFLLSLFLSFSLSPPPSFPLFLSHSLLGSFFLSSLTGKIELTLELVDGEEGVRQPVGRGREDPNVNPRLEEPNRPDSSFFWLTSPLKFLRHVVFRRYKCCCISLCIILVAVSLALFLGKTFFQNLIKKLLKVGPE